MTWRCIFQWDICLHTLIICYFQNHYLTLFCVSELKLSKFKLIWMTVLQVLWKCWQLSFSSCLCLFWVNTKRLSCYMLNCHFFSLCFCLFFVQVQKCHVWHFTHWGSWGFWGEGQVYGSWNGKSPASFPGKWLRLYWHFLKLNLLTCECETLMTDG